MEKVDFVTSIGYGDGGDQRKRLGLPGDGPKHVVTDLCVFAPDPVTNELTVTHLQPGATREQVQAATGWQVKFAETVEKAIPKIEYFATSLPAMLLFEDDLEKRNGVNALFLKAQALYGLGQVAASEKLLRHVLKQDANHSGAHDLFALCASLGEKAGKR